MQQNSNSANINTLAGISGLSNLAAAEVNNVSLMFIII